MRELMWISSLKFNADPPLVSVIVPIRNAAVTLRTCLSSLTSQTLERSKWELIAVDNNSTGDDLRILKEFVSDIRIVREKRLGSSAARNRGASVARAPLLAFIDADCIARSDWLVALLRAAVSRSDVQLFGGQIVPNRSHCRMADYTQRLFCQFEAIERFNPPYVITANMMIRRQTFEDLGGFDPQLLRGHDVDLGYRAFFTKKISFAYVPEAVTVHRHPQSLKALWRLGWAHGRAAADIAKKYSEEQPKISSDVTRRTGTKWLAGCAGKAVKKMLKSRASTERWLVFYGWLFETSRSLSTYRWLNFPSQSTASPVSGVRDDRSNDIPSRPKKPRFLPYLWR